MNNINIIKIRKAYHDKFKEYSKHTPEELKAIWEESQKDKKKRIGGIYKKAFLDVLAKKMNEKKDSENLETD